MCVRTSWLSAGTRVLFAVVALVGLTATPASAVHFFSACDTDLQTPDPGAAASVSVQGFAFSDQATGTPVTQITAGESVNFIWGEEFCHSVTFVPDGLTPPDLSEGNPNLSRAAGTADTKTVTLDEPGVYLYYCEHHWPAGMIGTVVVTP